MAHNLYSQGTFDIGEGEGSLIQLEGRFAFINQIEQYNNEPEKRKHPFRCLSAREEQYRKFLFYKYFFANEKPLIITEGKTDIAYIKSALKNLYMDYPNLISKKSDTEFEFKITFL